MTGLTLYFSIINVAFVFFKGLEAQLLGLVVRKERPDLEETKDSLVRGIASGKKELLDLENEILRSVVYFLLISAYELQASFKLKYSSFA